MKKKSLNNFLLDENSDEEDCDIVWNKKKEIEEYFDDDEEIDINKLDEEIESDENELINFDMTIVQEQDIKKVRITFELNVMLNNKNKKICIDVMINKSTYLKLAEELN